MRILTISSLKPKLTTSAFKMFMKRATEKHKLVNAIKSKPKMLRHFKVDPVLKIDEFFYMQAESMGTVYF